ncbi:iron-sulfur cluster assembly scaffold protein [Rhodopirellula europaea]|uniref:iron-sulfur cluster assembly scaffold protein n=1 Tax=Rhodopirellula europaea TaxID=1263866 RepID=UPI003D270ED9
MPNWPSIDSASDELIDHIESPFHCGECPGSSIRVRVRNPLCGDEVEIQLRLGADRIEQAWFVGQGCVISQASASLFCQHVEGLTLQQATSLAPPDALELLGCPISPLRQRCALLAFEAFSKLLSPESG